MMVDRRKWGWKMPVIYVGLIVMSRSWALTQRSRSFTCQRTTNDTKAGSTPITNITRQLWPFKSKLNDAARKNPTAQADWRTPAAFARFPSGQVSATSAAPAAHSPPIPKAVRKR